MKNLTQEEKNLLFIEKARRVHGDKYNYDKVLYIKNKEKVIITCPIHGDFEQTPGNHLSGYGCKECGKLKTRSALKKSLSLFIIDANKIHGNKYNYSKVKYVNKKTKITLICPIHGEFEITPDSHLNLHAGCNKCAQELRNKSLAKTLELFILDARKVHGNKYDYSKVKYKNSYEEIIIICPIHGEFISTPHKHLDSKCGCKKCTLKSQEHLFSKLCKDFQNEYIEFEVSNIPWLKGQRFDIYFPKYNIAIEYNGEQHYRPIHFFGGELQFNQQIQRDNLKREKCKENNCTLFEMKYNYTDEDYNNLINNILIIIKNYENLSKN